MHSYDSNSLGEIFKPENDDKAHGLAILYRFGQYLMCRSVIENMEYENTP